MRHQSASPVTLSAHRIAPPNLIPIQFFATKAHSETERSDDAKPNLKPSLCDTLQTLTSGSLRGVFNALRVHAFTRVGHSFARRIRHALFANLLRQKTALSADTSLMGESLVFVAVMAIAHFTSVQFLSLSRRL